MTDQEQCQHVWLYDHQVYEIIYMRCPYCGLIRPAYPGEVATQIAMGLKIRHDDKDGDV